MKKRLLFIALGLCMVLSLLPFRASAANSVLVDETGGGTSNFDRESGFSYYHPYNKSIFGPEGDEFIELWIKAGNSKSTTGNVTIPGRHENGIVTRVRSQGFWQQKELTGVTIPDSVRTIGADAFNGCSSLESIQLPSGLAEIETDAFRDTAFYNNEENWDDGVLYIGSALIKCKEDVSSLKIREGTTTIADRALPSGLERLEIPKSVQYIGYNNINFLFSISSIIVSPQNPYYCVENGVLYNREKTELIKCPPDKTGSLILPDTVKTIYDYAFQDSKLSSVVLPNGLTTIGGDAFHFSDIKQLNIPDTVTEIGWSAFSGIEKYICELKNGIYYLDNVLVKMEDYSFDGVIEPGTRMIMIHSFSNISSSETNVIIPDSVEIIEPRAFEDSKFGSIKINGKNLCLQKMTFYNATVNDVILADGVASIQPDALDGYIKNVIIQSPNTELSGSCFSETLESISLPDGLTEIPKSFCRNCRNLKSIHIPKTVTTIGNGAFVNCESLETIRLPETVKKLGDAAFLGCTQLKEVTILNPSIQVGASIFKECEQAIDLYYNGTEEQWNSHSENNKMVNGKNITVHFMKESVPTAQPTAKPTVTPAPTAKPTASPAPTVKPEVKNPFKDVSRDQYYYEPVLWAVNHEPQITAGTAADAFNPNNPCTRGQIVTFLWRANGQPEPTITKNPFSDVKPSDYFYKAVLWAVEKEITAGTSATTFSPNDTVTRAQTVTFLWRAEGKPAVKADNPFKDVPAKQYYTDAVLWAVKQGITQGTSATTFSPANPCTRAQIVTFLYRDMA